MASSSLKPINTPICPYCRSKKTARGGYVVEKKGSLWKCREEACGKEFLIKTMVLKPA